MKNLFKLYYKAKISFWNTFSTEWKSIKSDKAVISTFLSVTIIILVVYTYIYSNQVVKEVPVAIVNQDATKMSRDYIAMLDATEGTKAISTYTDLQEAKRAYYSKNVQGIVIIPKDFEKNIRSGKQVVITTFSDASNMVFYKRILGDVTTINGYFSAGIFIKKEMAKGVSVAKAQENYTPIQAISTSLFNTTAGYATYIIPVLTALIVQLVLLMGIGILSGSRRETVTTHTNFPRLLHKGGTIPVLLAKACLYTAIFMVIIPIQVGIVYALFGIPVRSSLLLMYIFIIPYVFSVVFLGITISALFKRREDSIVFLVLLSIPSLMLSGLSFPIESFSEFYQLISKIIPSTPGINGFVRLTQMEASFLEIINEWNHLWILTAIYFVFAAISLKIRALKEFNHLNLIAKKEIV
ncbi:ABC transporter permease [Lutibacter maritimus]|uniref:ABC-2 type transport system permease protein n=1 Tax=Lutibacter maritimus TaxID=593133 RepID=A0A1I6NWW0_9FLAO|nr:ABC transporter permease [Lutibacter maritimus]SFS32421.1 ABC-2 type transport system permease protein [Lutibacter maritimus]